MNSDEPTADFSRFAPRAYLDEYYAGIGPENQFLLRFLHEAHAARPPLGRMLELGGGPTVYQLISACHTIEEIVFAEYLEANRREVESWREGRADAFDWDPFFLYVLGLEGAGPGDLALRKAELRHKLRRVIPYDAKRERPFDTDPGLFDLVGVNFCLESITRDEAEYRFSLRTLSALLPAGGRLIMTALKNARFYHVGDLIFPAFPLDEKSLDRYLTEASFGTVRMRSLPAEKDQGYEGMLAITAVKV